MDLFPIDFLIIIFAQFILLRHNGIAQAAAAASYPSKPNKLVRLRRKGKECSHRKAEKRKISELLSLHLFE